jgi:predicted nuclease of predicted toxin-antitoxin system
MKFWLDAHISPSIAKFLKEEYGIETFSLRSIGLRDADDDDIFFKARSEGVVFFTKDADFISLVEKYGSPPQVVWLAIGNTSNFEMRELFKNVFGDLVGLLQEGNSLIEIRHGDKPAVQR